MGEIRITDVLHGLIKYAERIGGGNSRALTAERYLVAVIDFIAGEFDIGSGRSESRNVLKEILGNDLDVEKAKECLMGYISARKILPFADDLYMSKRMADAQSAAGEWNMDAVTPELLLKCILENPSDAVKKCLQYRMVNNRNDSRQDTEKEAFARFFAAHSDEKIVEALEYVSSHDIDLDQIENVPADIREILEQVINLYDRFGEEICMKYFNDRFLQEDSGREDESVYTSDRNGSKSCVIEEEGEDIPSRFDRNHKSAADSYNKTDDADENITLGRKNTDGKSGYSGDAREQIAKLTEKVKDIRQSLMNTVFGQDKAVNVFASGYFQSELLAITDKTKVRPATFLFAGPPGVGKTFLAESAAKILGLPFARFDMSEYCEHEAAIEFCGSDNVYKNSKGGNFTTFINENPKCIVLLDEIEKAHISIIHLFLQILDAGRIRDNNSDKELSLKDAILIFTTNAGRPFYENAEQGDFSAVSRKVILRALQNDINPENGRPYFPAAICSRFASGNVVMFNNITAPNLRDIARREVLRHAENFEREIGIKIAVDERVFSALLYAEGGAADARTVRSRAEAFLDDELFELFRLIGADDDSAISSLDKIQIGVNLNDSPVAICELFENMDAAEVLLFASDKTAEKCKAFGSNCVFWHTDDPDKAVEYIRNHDIQVILIDMYHDSVSSDMEYLNAEDIDSAGRDFMWKCHELYADIPVYILETEKHSFNSEERVSFTGQGVRGFLNMDAADGEFTAELGTICSMISQQNSMKMLARSNQIITYETAQRIGADGKTAEIQLFDFELQKAMDAEESKSIISNVTKPNVRFDQVIGAEDAKNELKFFVDYLKNPKKFCGTGLQAPKGVLLYGPPGTGKTMLAKAMASESDVTFITAEGNQFLRKYIGEGPEKVHELFRIARKYAPAILFIDEIDAIAKERKGENTQGTEAVLTAFLTEMDGFKNDITKPVFVLAATNFEVEPGTAKSLDPALMRRFDRRVYIDLPNREDRIRYMRMRLAGNPSYQITDEKLENLALRSTGMSLAELESVFELALRSAIRDGNMKVTDDIIDDAFETFNGGEKKEWDISYLERTARHEAGHALLCWHSGEKPSYVTVAARGSYGGYMLHVSDEEKSIYTKDDLMARIRTALGGRAAELVYYGAQDGLSTSASGDLLSATRTAESLICIYGMHEAFGLGVITPESIHDGPMALKIRNEVNRILDEMLQDAMAVIAENRGRIDALVEALMKKTHLSSAEIQQIFETASH